MTEMTEKTGIVQGRIIRALGGFYYIDTPDGLVECRARGVFRKDGVTPYVGDHRDLHSFPTRRSSDLGDLARAELTGEGKGYLVELLPRKNFLIRPPVANIDLLVLVVSTVSPAPNRFVLDKMLAVAEHKGIEPMLAVTKSDLRRDPELLQDYRKAGYRCLELSSATGEGVAELRELLTGGRLIVFSGNTGAGKSSLLNALEPGLGLATGEVSEKLGRGRHTTRHVELYPVGGGFLADTPGFSSVELEKFAVIRKEELAGCFREFAPYVDQCRFGDCSHTGEKGCAVVEAVERGEIARSRFESYCTLYEDAKKLNDWELPGYRQKG